MAVVPGYEDKRRNAERDNFHYDTNLDAFYAQVQHDK
jgi:hypothetical protein